jgi:hypothetical protein
MAALPPEKSSGIQFMGGSGGGGAGPVWAGMENLTPTGFDPRIGQPVTSPYTDGAIPAQLYGVLGICVNAAWKGTD